MFHFIRMECTSDGYLIKTRKLHLLCCQVIHFHLPFPNGSTSILDICHCCGINSVFMGFPASLNRLVALCLSITFLRKIMVCLNYLYEDYRTWYTWYGSLYNYDLRSSRITCMLCFVLPFRSPISFHYNVGNKQLRRIKEGR